MLKRFSIVLLIIGIILLISINSYAKPEPKPSKYDEEQDINIEQNTADIEKVKRC